MRLREFASVPYRLEAKAGPRDVCVVPLDGHRVVPNEDLTTEDRAALGWAVSTERALGAALVERVRSGGSGVTAGELSVIRREWEGEGRPAPERHVHRSAVAFDDGTAVTAVSFFADDPYSREVLPSFGLYLDERWAPSWPHSHLDWPDFGYRRTGTRCVLRSSISLTEPGGVSQWRWGAWVAWSNPTPGRRSRASPC